MNQTEKKLKRLFDYQKFARHAGLALQIDGVENKYLKGESEIPDDMMNVSAAGDVFSSAENAKSNDENHSV